MRSFIGVAKENKWDGFMSYPGGFCQNKKDYSSSKILYSHQLRFGFMSSYNCWTKHEERGVIMEDNEEEEDDKNYHEFPEYGGTAMGEDEELTPDAPADDLGWAIVDAKRDCKSEKEKLKFKRMLEDHKKLLYPIMKMARKS
jgi:hypothetical protein